MFPIWKTASVEGASERVGHGAQFADEDERICAGFS